MLVLYIIAILLFVLVGLIFANEYRFNRMVDAEVRQLFSDMQPQGKRTITSADWQNLPESVQKYLSRSLNPQQPAVDCVRLKQTGTIRTAPGARWMPFVADQYFTTTPPGLVWRAKAEMLPFLWISARDKYVAQRGEMLIRLMSSLTVARANDPALASAAFMRFIAEMMWFPMSMIEHGYLRWEAVDARSARAIANDKGVEVVIIFHFNEDGDIASVEAKRFRDAKDPQPTGWYGFVKAFSTMNGVRIPSEVEVGWELETGYFAYWRGTITEIDYNTPALYGN